MKAREVMTTARVARAQGARRRIRISSLHVAAIAVGVVAAVLNFLFLTSGGEASRVAVLAVDVPAGSVIDADHLSFRPVEVAAAQLDRLFVEESASLAIGQVAALDLREGELLAAGALRPPAAPSTLRAFSIAIPPERAVAGALAPGDRIDVLVADAGEATWLAADLEVLSVAGGEGGIGLSSFSITVAADAPTIARIAAALDIGEVSVVRATGAAPLVLEEPEDG